MSDEDPPLTRAELAELHRLRIGKPPSYAAPANSYQNAERWAKLKCEREEAERKKKFKRWKDDCER